MGQQLRRAVGRVKDVEQSLPSKSRVVVDKRPPKPPSDPTVDAKVAGTGQSTAVDDTSDETPRYNAENVLEEKDPQYDAMLNQMVGRIRGKPGGKAEMGEASVGERSGRPLPKLRNTTYDSGRYEERPAPPGTLNVAQLRHVMLLYQGKADDHSGPMDVHQIAEKYRIEVAEVRRITQFLSLPPEDSRNKQNKPYQ